MEAYFLPILKRFNPFYIFTIAIFLFGSCQQKTERKINPSFYYWKTKFSLAPKEGSLLKELSVKKLYLKFFDIEWNNISKKPVPVATINFNHPIPAGITVTPVVFITNETIAQSASDQITQLANNLIKLLSGNASANHIALSNEVQIDCDWTANTRSIYFALLDAIKKHPFLKNKKLSATIRLHQLKFISLNGVPPVDKGLLMCYNLGNLNHPEVQNSILDLTELKKYTNNLKTYPLALDIALPIFNWYVWFRGEEYKGLIHDFPNEKQEQRILFESDTALAGYEFKKGDWLRYESSSAERVNAAAKHLSKGLKADELNVILYHLDEHNLNNYKEHELEDIFNSFR